LKQIFAAEVERGIAAKTQNISRKGAKPAKKLNFRTWRSWYPSAEFILSIADGLRVLGAINLPTLRPQRLSLESCG
jgi:hypothetical protein